MGQTIWTKMCKSWGNGQRIEQIITQNVQKLKQKWVKIKKKLTKNWSKNGPKLGNQRQNRPEIDLIFLKRLPHIQIFVLIWICHLSSNTFHFCHFCIIFWIQLIFVYILNVNCCQSASATGGSSRTTHERHWSASGHANDSKLLYGIWRPDLPHLKS